MLNLSNLAEPLKSELTLHPPFFKKFKKFVRKTAGNNGAGTYMIYTTPPQPLRASLSTEASRHWERTSKSSSGFLEDANRELAKKPGSKRKKKFGCLTMSGR